MSRAMKDSGVEWIGEIPENWEVIPSNLLFYNSSIKAVGDVEQLTASQKYGVISQKRYIQLESQMPVQKINLSDLKIVDAGDFVISLRSFQGGIEIAQESGGITPAYTVLKERTRNTYTGYFKHFFKSEMYIQALRGTVLDTIREGKAIRFNNFSMVPLVLPSQVEQKKIADFLDEKSTHIDSIISQTKKSIEAFKAYKQALITETVTKGLSPDVKMKGSGIEWIGEIPEHWKVCKLKYILSERSIRSKTGEEEPLSMSQKYGLIKTKDMDLIPNMTNSYVGNKIVEKNDLVFNKLKAHLGVFSVSNYEGIVSPDYAVYYSKEGVNVKFLEYVFKTANYITEFKKRSRGIAAGLTRLYTNDLFAIKCGIPSLKEQTEIVDYINQKSFHIDSLIADKEKMVQELEEYKKALIYEYVTGKKEV